MKRFLFDTNIASYLIKEAFPALAERVRSMPPGAYSISAVTEAELRFGAARKPPEAKVHRLLPPFLDDIQIEPWDSECAQNYAQLAAKLEERRESLSIFDTMIAAHALAHDFTLVTHDKAFRRVQHLKVEDWTKGPQRA